MTDFRFDVDEAYARKHNEFFRDAKRAQLSAALLALILFIVIGVIFAIKGVVIFSIAMAIILGVFALLCLPHPGASQEDGHTPAVLRCL